MPNPVPGAALPFSCGLIIYCSLSYAVLSAKINANTTPTTENSSSTNRTPTPQTYIFTFPEVYVSTRSVTMYYQEVAIATLFTGNITLAVSVHKQHVITRNVTDYIITNHAPLVITVMSANSSVTDTTLHTVRIYSSDVINVYAFNFFSKKNVDAALMKPVDVLGREYVVLTLPYNNKSNNANSFVVATAVEDGTNVTICKGPLQQGVNLSSFVSTAPLQVSPDGLTLTTTLTHALQTVSVTQEADLTGLKVFADKPFALSCGVSRNRLEGSCCRDHLWAQLPGVEAWGREYLTFPTTAVAGLAKAEERNDLYYLAGAEENTTVYLDRNSSLTLTLTQAMTWYQTSLDALTGFHAFSADSPFLVVKTVQGVQSIIDPCMVTLTPTSHWATTLTFPMPEIPPWKGQAHYDFRMAVLMEESQTADFRVNSVAPNIMWEKVATTENFSNSSASGVAVVGGELNDTELSRLGDRLFVLSTVTGTSRMAAYVTAFTRFRGLCFALGGDASETKDWTPGGSLLQCHGEPATTPVGLKKIPVTDAATTSATTTPTSATTVVSAKDTSESSTGNAVASQATSTEAQRMDTTTITIPASSEGNIPTDTATTSAVVTNEDTSSTTTEGPEPSTTTYTGGTDSSTTMNTGETDSSTTMNTGDTDTSTDTAIHSTTEASPSSLATSTKTATTTQTQTVTQIPACRCVNTSVETLPDGSSLAAEAARIRADLLLSTKNLSSYVRRVTSASDNRTSSVAMGILGVLTISFVVLTLVAFDLMRLVVWLCETYGQTKNLQTA